MNPSLCRSPGKLEKLFTQKDLDEIHPGHSFDELVRIVENGDPELNKVKRELRIVRDLAHRKMIVFNRAYEEIKSRASPQEWNTIAGYDFKNVFDENRRNYIQKVLLEGRGEVRIFYHGKYSLTAGPYLFFDFGPNMHRVQDGDHYRHWLNIKHFFAHLELKEGREVSMVLLKPLIDHLNLSESVGLYMRELLSKGMKTEDILGEIKKREKIEPKPWAKGIQIVIRPESRDETIRQNLNEIIYLNRDPSLTTHSGMIDPFLFGMSALGLDRGIYQFEHKFDRKKLTLTDHTTTTFTEADHYLFLTLAYGPMLTQG